MKIRKLFRIILISSLLASILVACRGDSPQFIIPSVAFETRLVLSEPSNFPIQSPGGWIYAPGGYRGLIVYRTTIGTGANDFAVFDRACPQHYDQACGVVEVEANDLFLRCPCDNAQYLIIDGSPTNGNGGQALQPYARTFDGLILTIYN